MLTSLKDTGAGEFYEIRAIATGLKPRQRKPRRQIITLGYIPFTEKVDSSVLEKVNAAAKLALDAILKTRETTVKINLDHFERKQYPKPEFCSDDFIDLWSPFNAANISYVLDIPNP